MSGRVALIARLRPERAEEYLAMHRNPDPRALSALERAQHRNYAIHRHGELLVATFDYEGGDLAADRLRMRSDPGLKEWMSRTSACQLPVDAAADAPIWTVMEEIFRHD